MLSHLGPCWSGLPRKMILVLSIPCLGFLVSDVDARDSSSGRLASRSAGKAVSLFCLISPVHVCMVALLAQPAAGHSAA